VDLQSRCHRMRATPAQPSREKRHSDGCTHATAWRRSRSRHDTAPAAAAAAATPAAWVTRAPSRAGRPLRYCCGSSNKSSSRWRPRLRRLQQSAATVDSLCSCLSVGALLQAAAISLCTCLCSAQPVHSVSLWPLRLLRVRLHILPAIWTPCNTPRHVLPLGQVCNQLQATHVLIRHVILSIALGAPRTRRCARP
jgi:hypothetical protein